jgi:hypothetical protein
MLDVIRGAYVGVAAGARRRRHEPGGRLKEVGHVIPAVATGLGRGDRVLVRYGRFAGRVGEVVDVFRREVAGRKRDVVWVRFRDRAVEGFDPKNLLPKGDHS